MTAGGPLGLLPLVCMWRRDDNDDNEDNDDNYHVDDDADDSDDDNEDEVLLMNEGRAVET